MREQSGAQHRAPGAAAKTDHLAAEVARIERLVVDVDRRVSRLEAALADGRAGLTGELGPVLGPARPYLPPSVAAEWPARVDPPVPALPAPTTSTTNALSTEPSPLVIHLPPATAGRPPEPAKQHRAALGAEPSSGRRLPSPRLTDLEAAVSGRGLAWLGGLALLIGAVFFLSLAFSRGWIGPTARVAIGLAAGLALTVGGGWVLQRRDPLVGKVLVGVGVGIWNVAWFAASNLYGLVAPEPALLGVLAGSVLATAIAIRADAQELAVFGLVAALVAPAVISWGADRLTLAYLFVVLVATTVLAFRKAWHWLPWAAFLVTFPQVYTWWLGGAVILGSERNFGIIAGVLIAYWLVLSLSATAQAVFVAPGERRRPSRLMALLLLATTSFVLMLFWLTGSLFSERAHSDAYVLVFPLVLGAVAAAAYGADPPSRPYYLASSCLAALLLFVAVPDVFGAEPFNANLSVLGAIWTICGVGFVALHRRTGSRLLLIFAVCYLSAGFASLPARLADQHNGLPMLGAWAALAVAAAAGVHWLAPAGADGGGRTDPLAFVPLGAMAALAGAHLVLLDLPYDQFRVVLDPLVRQANLDGAIAAALVAIGAIGVAAVGTAPWLRSGAAATAIAVVGYLTGFALGAAPMVVVLSGLAVAALYVARQLVEPWPPTAVAAWLLAVATAALLVLAPPSRLVVHWVPEGSVAPIAQVGLAAVAWVAALAFAARQPFPARARSAAAALAAFGAVWVLSVAVVDGFQRQLATGDPDALARQGQVALSVLWAVLGGGLILLGLARLRPGVRLAGLALLGLATVKVFLWDLRSLDASYRVLSFIALGALLLVSSYAYRRVAVEPAADAPTEPESSSAPPSAQP